MACVHRWKIKPPNGPTSEGRCTRCHEKREFANSIETQAFTGQPLGRKGKYLPSRKPRSKDIYISPPSGPTRVQ